MVTKKKERDSSKPSGKGPLTGIGAFSHWPWIERNADLLAALIYFVVSFILILPGIRHSYDSMHHTNLLMSSIRILKGQVPFRDFYPWYGPLYHYFVAGWVWLLGRDLLSVKIFLAVISPLISMAMFIAALRYAGIGWPGRVFAVLMSAAWGMDRLVHCGATKSVLGLFFIGLWTRGIAAGKGGLIRGSLIPAVLLLFFYSPDAGAYLLIPALVFAVRDLAIVGQAPRKKAMLDYFAGAGVSFLVFIGLYYGTDFTGTYLRFFSYTSSNMIWAYGIPMPEPGQMLENPQQALYFLPPVIIVGSAIIQLKKNGLRGLSAMPVWIPAVMAYAVMLWGSTYIRTDPDHLLFALPPTVMLMATAFDEARYKKAVRSAFIILIILGTSFFTNSVPDLGFWKIHLLPNYESSTPAPLGRIFTIKEEAEMVGSLKDFIAGHGKDSFLFPLHSFEAYRAGQPLLLSFDDLFWANEPSRREAYLAAIKKAGLKYLVLDYQLMFPIYGHADSDELMDYISANYRSIGTLDTSIIYERNDKPVEPAFPIREFPGPFILKKANDYRVEWSLDDPSAQGYVEMEERFIFSPGLLQHFSKPMVEVFADGKMLQHLPRYKNGRDRIRSTKDGGSYRAYFPGGTKRVELKVVFPGVLNFRPESIEIRDVRFKRLRENSFIPYTDTYLSLGY